VFGAHKTEAPALFRRGSIFLGFSVISNGKMQIVPLFLAFY